MASAISTATQPAKTVASPNNLEAFWMPFTSNRQFKSAPRLFVAAKDMHYTTADGRQVLDGTAGLWCVNAGHGRRPIVEAIQAQAEQMDYSPPFQMGHPGAFELASRLAAMMPGDLDHIFFSNSGSEAVDTALKIALAYHTANGEASRQRLIGRERGYHGVGFGGISVGGMVANRKQFANHLPQVDHLPHTHSLEHNAFSRGQPEWGAERADVLEDLVQLHGAENVAAVIVEPMAASTGVLVPPKDYLERLRALCDKHGILLIFDEVITGFGRMGSAFAAEHFDVQPDLMTFAKGVTNGAVPMGGVAVRKDIHDCFMHGPKHMVELFHGYTYSAHPLACAAGMATMELYQAEGLFERAAALAPYWEDAVHSLRDHRHVIDIRSIGMVAGIELEPRDGKPAERAFDAFLQVFEAGAHVRVTGETIAMSPPLIVSESQIDELIGIVGKVLSNLD